MKIEIADLAYGQPSSLQGLYRITCLFWIFCKGKQFRTALMQRMKKVIMFLWLTFQAVSMAKLSKS